MWVTLSGREICPVLMQSEKISYIFKKNENTSSGMELILIKTTLLPGQ